MLAATLPGATIQILILSMLSITDSMADSIHPGDSAMDGEVITVDGMIHSGVHFILTGDLLVLGVIVAAGLTSMALVSALDMVMVMVTEDSTNLIIISTITIIIITTV